MTADLPYRCDPSADGGWNMAADEALAEGLAAGGIRVRFYGWLEPTLSLGAFQRCAALEALPALARLPVVRRPSGGGAILHGTDVTCAVAVCRSHPWGGSPQRLYDAVHMAAVDVLREMGLAATLVPAAGGLPTADEGPFLCFDRRSAGDVVVDDREGRDHKVLGSAQRRHRAAVVQHGSLLLRASPGGHLGLEDLSARRVDAADVIGAWIGRLAASLGLAPRAETQPLDPAERGRIESAAARYRGEAWTLRR